MFKGSKTTSSSQFTW